MAHQRKQPSDLDKWGEGHRILTVFTAREVVRGADACKWLIEAIRTGKGLEKFGPPPNVQAWLALYRNHRKIEILLARFFFGNEDGEDVLLETYGSWKDTIATWSRATPEELPDMLKAMHENESLQEAKKAVTAVVEEQNEWIRAEARGEEASPDIGESVVRSPEMQFLMRVWMPCILLYGDYPSKLIRKARQGKLDAIRSLLYLDKAIVHEPKIANGMHNAYARNRARFAEIKRAFGGKIPKLNRKQVKARLAGMLSHILGGIDKKLTAAEMRRLFDSAARTVGEEKSLIDRDISTKEDTFKKRVQREREHFNLIPKAGQK